MLEVAWSVNVLACSGDRLAHPVSCQKGTALLQPLALLASGLFGFDVHGGKPYSPTSLNRFMS